MALSITVTLTTIASQFDADPNRTNHIELAKLQTNANCYGDKYNYAVALRAAHTLTLSTGEAGNSAGASGPISGKREGDLSLSYANAANSSNSGDAYLSRTSYGQNLIDLRNGSVLGMSITGLDANCDRVTEIPEVPYGY